jgi:Enoyl-CoA hydratase/isomerase
MSAVQYAVNDRVARLTLNRPERANGITRGMLTQLEQAVERADLDPAVSVLLLGGNGKGFCGGYDGWDPSAPSGCSSPAIACRAPRPRSGGWPSRLRRPTASTSAPRRWWSGSRASRSISCA